MASSLFSRTQNPQQNNILQMIQNIKNMGNPNAVMQNLLMTNPQFKQFYEQNKNKPIEQIARENNIDINQLKQLIGIK